MASRKNPPIPIPIPIGNCGVVVEAKNFTYESNQNSLQISISRNAKIKISAVDDKSGQCCDDIQPKAFAESGDCYFVLVNPKDADDYCKNLVQEVLKLYGKELPAMSYAANTGKKSKFLEKCVSNGKYCTLLLIWKSTEEIEEIISAITFQIVGADSRYAEVPLAVVDSSHQQKGIGSLIYKELRNRLQNVGIHTVFCWADKESEQFWVKQGFTSIGEVDIKGRARRLPIKVDVRRALCFPGGSTLMSSHLHKPTTNLKKLIKIPFIVKPSSKHSSSVAQDQDQGKNKENPNVHFDQLSTDGYGDVADSDNTDDDPKTFSVSSLSSRKRVWESSSTLKSKKVKGTYQTEGELDLKNSNSRVDTENNCYRIKDYANEYKAISEIEEHISGRKCYRIMLMNIADEAKKSSLTKIIEGLGGSVTSDGSLSTHVITGKVRKTLNFCTALCSGVWIISPNWLKESFRKGRFLDEMEFILKDEEYEKKYGSELKESIIRANSNPRSLLKGYNVYLAPHVQPPRGTLSAIVISAGGTIIRGLEKVKEVSKTIFVASEDDMEEAVTAVKNGILLCYSSEWLMNCIMKQQLDFNAHQYVESL